MTYNIHTVNAETCRTFSYKHLGYFILYW